VTRMSDTTALLSAILRVVHPDLFRAGASVIRAQGQDPDLRPAIEIWASAFNGMSAISNRATHLHADRQTRSTWFDVLATIGGDDNLTLNMPDIGIQLGYSSGTVVAICGSVLRHEVPASIKERLCCASFMRDKVHDRARVESPYWPRMMDLPR
jgi:hypothetical protein